MNEIGRYRRLYTALWAHPAFVRLTERDRLTSLYVLSGPQQNRIGLARFSPAAAAEDLTVPVHQFRESLTRVCEVFGWHFDADARVLLIPSWWRFNEPANPKHLIGCLSDLREVPPTPLLETFVMASMERLPESLHTPFSDRIRDRIGNGSSNGSGHRMANQELVLIQELIQVQEQEQEHTDRAASPPHGVSHRANGNGAGPAAQRESFETFWRAYPRKIARQRAWQAWTKLKPSADLCAQILHALAWQVQQSDWLKDAGRFVPHPTTWLNQARWQDEPSRTPYLSERTLASAAASREFLKS